jgi:HAD superfamily hydrolase (TIGR01509 family)
MIAMFADLDVGAIEAILCDADGCLFPSEEPAFAASAVVTNELLAELGGSRRFDAEDLRIKTSGRNFRTTAPTLALEEGHHLDGDVLERWVEVEQRRVTAHLAEVLRPDPEVAEPLTRLSSLRPLALVSSSAIARVSACLEATGLADLFPAEARFSAESSLPLPTSKPDPAIYRFATEQLGIAPGNGLAIEDTAPGVSAAVAAGIPTLGNLMFVPEPECPDRIDALRAAGATGLIYAWRHLELLLSGQRQPYHPRSFSSNSLRARISCSSGTGSRRAL